MATLVASMASAADSDDFDELPLAPLVPPEHRGEAEEQGEEGLEREDLLGKDSSGELEMGEGPELVGEWRHSVRAAKSPNAVLFQAGSYIPVNDSMVLGPRFGLVFERLLPIDGFRTRAEVSWTHLRLHGPQVIRGRGLDSGFAQVANLMGAGVAVAWHPLAATSPVEPFTFAGAGAVLSVSDSRIFSARERTMTMLPTLVAGAGLDVRAGPGKVRLESSFGLLDVAFGPDDSPVLRARLGIGLGAAYSLPL